MSWAKVDDGWWCHPKVMALPLAARGLWVSALSWSCAQRRSVVPPSFLAMVGASMDDVEPLVTAGLWIETPDGWEIHDWSEYQERSLSEKRAEAGRKGGLSRGKASKPEAKPKQDVSNDEASGQAGALPGPTLPVPPPPTPRAEPGQVRLQAVAAVAVVEAGTRGTDGAYCRGIRKEILDGVDGRLHRIEAELAAGKSPEDIAASWTTAAPDPLTGFAGRAVVERTGPRIAEFHGFDHEPAPAEVARGAIAAIRGDAS